MRNFSDATWAYVERIRNLGKRRYAEDYLDFLAGNRSQPMSGDYGIAPMTAQCVRNRLQELLQPPQGEKE